MSAPGLPCAGGPPCHEAEWWVILLIVLAILSICALGVCYQQKIACFEPEEKQTTRKPRYSVYKAQSTE